MRIFQAWHAFLAPQEVLVLALSELPRYVALDQLTPALGGTLHYSPPKWVGAHQVRETRNEEAFVLPCGDFYMEFSLSSNVLSRKHYKNLTQPLCLTRATYRTSGGGLVVQQGPLAQTSSLKDPSKFDCCSVANLCREKRHLELNNTLPIFVEEPHCHQLQRLLLVSHRWRASFLSKEHLVAWPVL